MPEGPEIRLEADRLSRVLEGQTVDEVAFSQPHLSGREWEVHGATIVEVRNRGKAMLVRFDNNLVLYAHNQLYGKWMVCDAAHPPETNRVLRVLLQSGGYQARLYSASEVALLTPEECASHPFLSRLGPDVLDESVRWQDVVGRLMEPAFEGRTLGALLLDQGFMAGVGNYLRSEILHASRLHPGAKPKALSRRQKGDFARALLALSRQSYTHAGVTNKLSRARRLKAQGLDREGYRFAVFGRSAEPCYECGTLVERCTVGSRRLYLCPACQPE